MKNHIRTGRWLAQYSTILAALLCACMTAPAMAVDKGDFRAPDLHSFTMTREEDGDGDGDGVNETHILHYGNLTGDRLFSMTTKGKLWAWSKQSHGGDKSDSNYVIRDGDCDGKFEERYSLDEEFHLPDCVK